MADPRFDGSLDAPFSPDGELLERVLAVMAAPTEPAMSATKPKRSVSKPRQFNKAIREIIGDTCQGTDLELLKCKCSVSQAKRLATNAWSAGLTTADDRDSLDTATVMVADWAIPADAFGFRGREVGRYVDQIRARLLRDWIVVPLTPRGMFWRVGWLDEETGSVGFLLDGLVAQGEVRRLWNGTYRSSKWDADERPWTATDSIGKAVSLLLQNRSATMDDIWTEMVACGLAGWRHNTIMNLLQVFRQEGLVGHRTVGRSSFWHALES